MELIINFLVLTALVSGVIIFFLHKTLISSTEGAIRRLNDEIAKANAKQDELAKKIKEADEELAKRRMEAKELAEKMRSDAEEESKEEREKIIQKAREEGEEIIAKAKGAESKLREEIKKEFDIKTINYSMDILNSILSENVKDSLDEILINEFIQNLQDVDMTKIRPDINAVEVITLNKINDNTKSRLSQIINEKCNRPINITVSTDLSIGGGVILKFGSMALDGSIKNLIREKGVQLQEEVDASQAN